MNDPKEEIFLDDKPAAPKSKAKKEEKVRKKTKKVSRLACKTCEHNIWTHFPKDPSCEVCRSCKTARAHCRSKVTGACDALPEPTAFADALTADHAILNEDDESRESDRTACVIQDRFTSWLQSYAAPTKNADDQFNAEKDYY